MKRIITFILLILSMSVCLMFGACSCNEDEEKQTKVIELNVQEVKLEIEGTFKLVPSVKGDNFAKFTYEVEKNEVINVDETGLITAKRLGTSSVTVKSGDLTPVYCEVTVAMGDVLPEVILSDIGDEAIEVVVGKPYQIYPKIFYDGKEYDDGIFTISVADSTFGSFANNNQTYTFTPASKPGEVQITISASWRGVDSFFLTKDFTVKIKDNVIVEVNNGEFLGKIDLLTVVEPGIDDGIASMPFEVGIYKNGVSAPINSTNFSIAIEDESIAIYDVDTKTISAVSNGATKISVKYTENGIEYVQEYPITVERPIREIPVKFSYFSAKTDALNLSSLIEDRTATVIEVYQNGEAIDFETVAGEQLVTNATALTTGVNESVFIFYTDMKVGYKVYVDVYGFVIRTPEDFKKLNSDYYDTSSILLNDIDMKDAGVFQTIDTLSGTIDGNGYTVYNLTVAGSVAYEQVSSSGHVYDRTGPGGFCYSYLEGSKLCNISFINMKGSVTDEQPQSYLGLEDYRQHSRGTIENVYLQTNMLNPDGTQKTKNSAIFGGAYTGLTVKNCIFEYPSLDIADNRVTGEGMNGIVSGYGLFYASNYLDTASGWQNLKFTDVYVISQSVNGNAMPLAYYSKNQTKGYYAYAAFSAEDLASVSTLSDRVSSDKGADRYYSFFPTYKFVKNADGTLSIVNSGLSKLNAGDVDESVLATGKVDGTVYIHSADVAKKVGVGLVKVTNGIKRFDNYADFINREQAIGTFNADCWDTSAGFPQWKNTQGNGVNVYYTASSKDVTDTVNPVPLIELEYAESRTDWVEISFQSADHVSIVDVLSVESSNPANSVVTITDNKRLTATKLGAELLTVKLLVDGVAVTKNVMVRVMVPAGEFDYGDTLEFSAKSGKFFKKDANGQFTYVPLTDIFGNSVELKRAVIDGREIAIDQKLYPTGYSLKMPEGQGADVVTGKRIALTSGNTTYNIPVNIYGLICWDESDLAAFNISNTETKLEGLYVLGRDIKVTKSGVTNLHFNYYVGDNSLGNASQDKSKSDFGFHGVFDGLGHTIDGIQINQGYTRAGGFFGYVGEHATFRNFAFTNIRNARVTNDDPQHMALVFAYQQFPVTIENAYFHFSDDFEHKADSVGLFYGCHAGTTLKNVIVDMPSPNADANNYFGYGIFARSNITNERTGSEGPYTVNYVKNVYMIARPNSSNGRIAPVINFPYEGGYDNTKGVPRWYCLGKNVIEDNGYQVSTYNKDTDRIYDNNNKYTMYSTNVLRVDTNSWTYSQPEDCLGRHILGDGEGCYYVNMRAAEVIAVTSQAELAQKVSLVGNWAVTANGVAWQNA